MGAGPTRAVVGAGTWGTTLALMLARGGRVTLLARDAAHAGSLGERRENARYVPGVALPAEIEVTDDPAALGDASELVVFAVPSRVMRAAARAAAPHVPRHAVVLSAAKGLEQGTLQRMTQVLAEELPCSGGRLAALSGPNLALEVLQGLPVVPSSRPSTPPWAHSYTTCSRIATSACTATRDVIGVELCGALKNIIAIAAGASERLGFGDNGKAGLITRGLAEMARLGLAAGANPLTFAAGGTARRRDAHRT